MAVFQPHLFSRTKDFSDEFAQSLTKFDALILLDIYPAREEPIAGISSKWLLDKINGTNKKLSTKEELVRNIKASSAEVILMMGAGDIGVLVETVKKELLNEN